MIPGGAEAEAGVAGLEAAAAEGAEAGAAALEEGAGAEASALAKESAAEAKRLKEAEAAIGRSMPEPELTNPYKGKEAGYTSLRFPEEAEEAATTANPLDVVEEPETQTIGVGRRGARTGLRKKPMGKKYLLKDYLPSGMSDVVGETGFGTKSSLKDVLADEGAALTKEGETAAAKYVTKPTRNQFEKIESLRGKAAKLTDPLKAKAKEALEAKADELTVALAKKLNLPEETVTAIGKRLPGETLGSRIARGLGATTTRQLQKGIGAAGLAAGQQFMSSEAESAAAEEGQKEAQKELMDEKNPKSLVSKLKAQTDADFAKFGRERADADAKAQADRERHLRMLEQMARGAHSGALASEYQRHRNRSYY